MKSSKTSRTPHRRGFTLAAVLVVMAAILLLTVGLLALVGIERKTARSYVDVKRAEWMAESGMEDVRTRLRELTDNDDYLVFSKTDEANTEALKDGLDYLFLARGKGGGEEVDFEVTPLFSGQTEEFSASDLTDISPVSSYLGEDTTSFTTLPWKEDARARWIDVTDDDDQVVGRYAFWVEDLQGKLDATQVNTEQERVEYPATAPGLAWNSDTSRREGTEAAFYALDPDNTEDDDSSRVDDRLEESRDLLISPGSVLAAVGVTPPLTRNEEGKLDDDLASSIEQNAVAGVQPYDERPTVPFAAGISEQVAGQPKLNLNQLLRSGSDSAAVTQFADWVDRALPEFVDRKGGFPDNYLETLAANAFDYADEDNEPRVKADQYRGIDGFPMVSEHLVKFRWEDVKIVDGRKYVSLSGEVFVELWNMTNQEVTGEFQLSYETNYTFSLGVIPDLNLGGDDLLGDPDVATPQLDKNDGYYWFPSQNITMRPNEYRVISCGEVFYKIDAGPASAWVTSPMTLMGEDQGEVGYRMRWNGVIVDQSRGNVKHPDMTLNYPFDTMAMPRQGVWATVSGHSYSEVSFDYVNNMGDPRMAYYITINQDPNDYPDNYSPGRRNIRWGNIYQGDGATKPKVYGRVMPSEWPDGGHNSSFGSIPAGVAAGRGSAKGDERIDPDAEQFMKGWPSPEEDKAPTRLSNQGRFFSESELGRVYDPIMWMPTYEKAAETSAIRGGSLPSGQYIWPLVLDASPSSDQYGGGNTLRIGRPEHPRFQVPGKHAAHLLDLFHAGMDGDEEDWTGSLVRIDGKVNVNTAPRDVLRALVVGNLKQDPALAEQITRSHQATTLMAPPTRLVDQGAPRKSEPADIIADAIIRSRPITCAADLASVEDADEDLVFGNPKLMEAGDMIEWDDSAAEEIFERVYNATTPRSRNFRVWVVGQALAPRESTSTAAPVVLAESRKVFTIFADPGDRTSSGAIDPAEYRPRVIYENDF
ncbi:Tfp pilus assembly protein PilV [Haloferula luteola]|uniref:Tfp pilus assembly protein PilV n=1 Tax=Haloferula luteola TaxID=595692 RepID=A0A840V7G7_9BACT|nr:hypothetical protein [Haloferula luteola]MBB5349900.1 Tfp pilus assembly protein PilV [Haloferula luteola]